jgi:hypothetical protein
MTPFPTRRVRFTRRTGLRLAALVAGVAVTATAAGCGASTGATDSSSKASAGEVLATSQTKSLIDGIVHKTVKPLNAKRLAKGLIPPTNRWFSGLVFGDQSQPVFPLPLSFNLTSGGFAFGQPTVTATEKTIAGAFKPDVAVQTGAASEQISAYDDLTVTVASLDASGATLGHTVIAEGSPMVSYTAAKAGKLSTALTFAKSGDFYTAQAGGVTYGLVVENGSVSGGTVSLDAKGTATWFAVPADGSADKLAALAASPITGGSLDYSIDASSVHTTLSYRSSGDTAFAAMPHQQAKLDAGIPCDLGTYPSIYGTLKLCSGTELGYATPRTDAAAELDLTKLDSAERKELAAQVTKDAAGIPAFPADSYFGGKALYRAAMIYRLATQLHLTGPAEQAKSKITATLDQWTDPQGCTKRQAFCFVYDDAGKGIIGMTPSFGSDEFNDHHFHYGYFLYAAAELAADDPSLVTKYAPVMNLLAADLATSVGSDSGSYFPNRRVFDAYAGHSWASGTSPFADGNNQESSSEAVTAWTGLTLWAKVSKNTTLETEATWMLSSEANAAKTYWTNFDTSQPAYSGYGHKVVSLNWGGKRDYATWFSPATAAILAIQLIPMSPAAGYLGGDSARIDANVAEATGGKFDQAFGDYLLMYSALAGESQAKTALATARTLDDKWIDDGNSRSYLLAWLMSVHS